jgi:hypothetical protein
MSKPHQPKSKRRKMRAFKLEEISVVDKPAQAGALATIMKRAGDMCTKGPEMTSVENLAKQMAALDRKFDLLFVKGKQRERDMLNRTPTRTKTGDEMEVWPEGEGPEFEKEPDEDEAPTSEGEDDGGVPYQGKPRRGDWPPGSDTPGPGGEMTPERASQVLQPYARDDGEEDEAAKAEDDELEELEARTHKFAQRLAKRFPRASNASLEKAMEGALHSSHASFDPTFGREREYAKRHDAAAIQHGKLSKGYTDRELIERLAKRFGADAVVRQFGR